MAYKVWTTRPKVYASLQAAVEAANTYARLTGIFVAVTVVMKEAR